MIYVESQHSQSINADSKNMLTHCVYQLANFEMKKARVITDTHSLPTFFFRIKTFFYLASFFHEPILKFVGFLGKGSFRNSLEKHYPFIGGLSELK